MTKIYIQSVGQAGVACAWGENPDDNDDANTEADDPFVYNFQDRPDCSSMEEESRDEKPVTPCPWSPRGVV